MHRPDGSVAVAGAGIAGLAAAIALSRAGFAVSVFERVPHLEEIGAGLQLSPNATRILAGLGVLDALMPKTMQPRAVEIRGAATLAQLAIVPLGAAAVRRWGAPYLTVHRGDLQAALLAVAGRHDSIAIRTGVGVRDVGFHEGGARMLLDDGTEKYCLFAIGADGVWSGLRQRMGQGRRSRYTGFLAWRAVAAAGLDIVPPDRVTAFLHPRFHLVAYPVRGGAEINLVAVAKSPAAPERWSNAADATSLLARMGNASPRLKDLIARAGPWTTWPIHDVPRDSRWIDQRGLALTGDAAHAMSPYAAQGAAMAIEDAAVLAGAVASSAGDIAGALSSYESLRRKRVARVERRGRFNRFAWHAWGPVALARDLVMSHRTPERLAADLDWLYGYDAELPALNAGSG